MTPVLGMIAGVLAATFTTDVHARHLAAYQ